MSITTTLDVREVDAVADLREVEALFAAIWRTSADRPPVNVEVLRALSHTGCYVAGAYEGGDRLVGASVGFLGGDGREDLHLHSHITGVADDVQGRHVGETLKLHQRSWCLERGVGVVTWTFDPLVRRNAWFNLHRLGADIVGFHRDFYGEMTDGLNAGDVSDRCVVRWDLDAAGNRPAVVPAAGDRVVAVPADIEALRRDDPPAARAARAALRTAFDEGGGVVGMTAAREYVLR